MGKKNKCSFSSSMSIFLLKNNTKILMTNKDFLQSIFLHCLCKCVCLCLLQLPICAGIWIKSEARDREESCFQKWAVMETVLLNRIALSFNFSLYGASRQEWNEIMAVAFARALLHLSSSRHSTAALFLQWKDLFFPLLKHKSITCSFAPLNQKNLRAGHQAERSIWVALLLKGCIKATVCSCWNVATVTWRIVMK